MSYTPVRASFPSKSKKATVQLRERGSGPDPRNNVYPALAERFQVSALDGHELLPRTRNFNDLEAARSYANDLWAKL